MKGLVTMSSLVCEREGSGCRASVRETRVLRSAVVSFNLLPLLQRQARERIIVSTESVYERTRALAALLAIQTAARRRLIFAVFALDTPHVLPVLAAGLSPSFAFFNTEIAPKVKKGAISLGKILYLSEYKWTNLNHAWIWNSSDNIWKRCRRSKVTVGNSSKMKMIICPLFLHRTQNLILHHQDTLLKEKEVFDLLTLCFYHNLKLFCRGSSEKTTTKTTQRN